VKNILFVEDDANIVEIFRGSLLRAGFEVLIAEEGIAAMKALYQARPDLVVLDLMVPRFSGVDVLKFIRTNPALEQAKVIIFSNVARMADIALEAEKIGADAFLPKLACTPEQLINVINALLCAAGGEHL
jgi:DNA-binding response OmpR family regulator